MGNYFDAQCLSISEKKNKNLPLYEGAHNSTACPSGEKTIKAKMSTEHLWNYTDGEKRRTLDLQLSGNWLSGTPILRISFALPVKIFLLELYLLTYLLTYFLTYLLTPWCRVLLKKLTGLQLVKKFPAFHGTPRFITALTSVRQLSLSWASRIQSIYPHPTSWRSILILSTHLHLGLPSGLLPSGFSNKTLIVLHLFKA